MVTTTFGAVSMFNRTIRIISDISKSGSYFARNSEHTAPPIVTFPVYCNILGETTRIIGGSIGYLELKFNSMCILPSPPKRLFSSARSSLKSCASDVSSTKSLIFILQQHTLSCGNKQTSSTTLVSSLCSFLNS